MKTWVLSNAEKKNVEERSTWTKDGVDVIRVEWFRWGTWTLRSDDRPDVDLDNPDGYDVYGSGIDWELQSMDDGVAASWEFPDDMDDDEKARIEGVYEDGWYDAMEEDGWENVDTEVFIHGPLDLTEETN
jgi:hypothetical protein